MLLSYVSDLHLDHMEEKDRDIKKLAELLTKPRVPLIIAGDISDGVTQEVIKFLSLINQAGSPVIIVLGNHDYINSYFPNEAPAMLRQATQDMTNIHILEKQAVLIDGVRFIGTTMWTPFALASSGKTAENTMPEYSSVTVSQAAVAPDMTTERDLTWKDVKTEHQRALAWLNTELSYSKSSPTVVVTHHAPSLQSITEKFKHHPLNSAFCANLDSVIMAAEPSLWIHGHTHNKLDYQLGKTRVLCNPHGYADTEDTSCFQVEQVNLI